MSSNFLIRIIGSHPDIAHIFIPTSLDTMTAYHLQEKIESLIRNGLYKYIINLEDVVYVSSAGIQVLHNVQRGLRSKHGGMILTNIPEKISHLFDTIGVTTIFEMTDTVEQAVEKFEPDEQKC